MLECKEYGAPELWRYFGVKNNDSLEEKMKNTYKVEYNKKGWGSNTKYTITAIPNRFKLFCVFDLGFPPQTDFRKLRDYVIYLLGDDDFNWRPAEMMEEYLRVEGHSISRQTIGKYQERLEDLGFVGKWGDCVYYRVYKHCGVQKHDIVSKEEYCAAWHQYFEYRAANPDKDSRPAYMFMYNRFGGVPRKQPRMEQNAFYLKELDMLYELATNSILEEVSGGETL